MRGLLPLLLVFACTRADPASISAALAALTEASRLEGPDAEQVRNDRAALLASTCSGIPGCAQACAEPLQAYAHVNPHDRAQVLVRCQDFKPAPDVDDATWVTQRLVAFVETGRKQLSAAQVQQLDCARSALGIDPPAHARSPACTSPAAPPRSKVVPGWLSTRNRLPDGGVIPGPRDRPAPPR